MRCRLWVWLLVATLSLSALLSACSQQKSGNIKVKVGEVTRSIFYAPQYVALSKGYFHEEGLDVQLQTTFGGDKTMTALLSDAIDIALVGSETSIYVYQQGAENPVINFAQLTQTDGTFLVAREKQATFSWEKLKGSVFLGQRKGGMPQMAGEFVLNKHGINPAKDLTLVQNIEFAHVASAFASGTGQYVQLFEPQASIIEKAGKGHVVASFGKESGRLPYTAYMAKQRYIDQHKEVVQKFTNAVYRGQRWVQSNSPQAVADVIAPYFKDIDHSIITNVVKRYQEQQSFALDPVIDEQEWNNLLEVLDAAGELKQRVQITDIVNNDFAVQAKQHIH
ncbi:ABC transporter substrate-binding protein [Paenibacillus sp. 481]|uniref:ABC transporter substrate-binding protein n=1 Tax=Paenibacillus sp. 481 TaxID=2835869 RepID=UPI001E46959C|nr:ABC transporter substrate-binding protein [Paenibacillus sp. 481]UHA76238.1 ABC transporter substrate-binding protein [Paenibacillus sp. 481]